MANIEETPLPTETFEVFISFASEDKALAKEVYETLKTHLRVFFSLETNRQGNFGEAVDNALDGAKCLVVVTTSAENVMRPWVSYEWRSFHQQDVLGSRKDEAHIVSLISGIDLYDLPRPLAKNQVFRTVEEVGRFVLGMFKDR